MKKTIAIISPDAVNLPLKASAPKFIREGDTEYPISDKCQKVAAPGKRAWEMATFLAKDPNLTVHLYIPDLNFPGLENIETDKMQFEVKKYNYKSALWDWSEELDRKLKQYNFVVIQTTAGVGFKNCATLPRSVNVIVDGWIPIMAELPVALLHYHKLKRQFIWDRFMNHYNDLLMRANCVLYANDRQRYYYEGQFFSIGKLGWKAFKFSPLLKVPYGVSENKIVGKVQSTNKLRILHWGSLYPWYKLDTLIEAVSTMPNVELDFVGIKHPRYAKLYESTFKEYFSNIDRYQNINIVPSYTTDKEELFSNYDCACNLAQPYLENKFAHRVRILDMMSYGLPVLTNSDNVFFREFDNISPLLYAVEPNHIREELEHIAADKSILNVDMNKVKEFQTECSWDKSLSPLNNYINQFSKDEVATHD